MAEKFRGKYRIPSARLVGWDYGRHAAYFVTICTHNHRHFFGAVKNDEMHLSEIGKIAYAEWANTTKIRPDMNLELGEFVVMPNHFHAIIIIGENKYNQPNCTDAMPCVSEDDGSGDAFNASVRFGRDDGDAFNASVHLGRDYRNAFVFQSKNLAAIIRGFKSAVTAKARKIRPDFTWLARFHDHIIRNDKSFCEISEYIEYNPTTWMKDCFYTIETNIEKQ